MSTLTQRDVEHVFEALRKGLVPERGLDAFAVGIEKQRGELHRQLDLAGDGEGTVKFLRGGYGCGKTFMARLAVLDAQAQGFATSFVVVSDNDLKFHRFDDVYRKVLDRARHRVVPRAGPWAISSTAGSGGWKRRSSRPGRTTRTRRSMPRWRSASTRTSRP